jgi:hypothetical protein
MNPIYYVNDTLGTTLAVVTSERVEIAPITGFGKPVSAKVNIVPPPLSSPETSSVPQQNLPATEKGQN